MVSSQNHSKSSFKNLVVQRKSAGNLTYEKPVFCDKGKFLIVPSGPSCHLYSTSTGDCIQELFTCSEDIISVQLHPTNPSEVAAVTEKGEVTIYNLQTNEIINSCQLILDPDVLQTLKVLKFNGKSLDVAQLDYNKKVKWNEEDMDEVKFLHAFVDCFHKINKTVVFASWCLPDEKHSHIGVFNIEDGEPVEGINFRKTALKKCGRNFVVGTVNKEKYLVGMSTTAVTVAHFSDEDRFCQETIRFTKFLTSPVLENTCIAFHPHECSFATGDSLGRIYVWRNILKQSPLKEEYHWHYLPVKDLAFTDYGHFLFSGGEENVLVKWSLNTQHKTFLPRLTSTIYHIQLAYENSTLAISTLDNRILITSVDFNNISTIENFSRWSGLGLVRSSIFSVDPKSGSFVLNGRTGYLQFLTPKDNGRLLYSVDITNRNYINRDRHQTIANTEVTHCKFSKSGQWMITAESRVEDTVAESRLKFWEFNDLKQEFSLNTNIEFPHENSEILSLEISSEDLAATTGNDNKFKVWAVFDAQQLNQVKKIWSVINVGTYRMLPCSAVDFSKDSSLMAVSFDHILTVWEMDDFTLKCSLSAPLKRDKIKILKFGNNELSHCVVTATDCNLSSWNVISLCMMWTVPLKVSLLVSDPYSKYMSVFSSRSSLFIFDPSSPSPVFVKENVSASPVISANFVVNPKTGSNSQLYFLNTDQELLYLENEGEEGVLPRGSDQISKKLTPFAAQIPERSRSGIIKKKKVPLAYGKITSEYTSTLLETPSHTLPNPSLFCMEILRSLSLSAGKPTSGNEENQNDEVTILENVSSENAVSEENAVDEEDLLKIKDRLFT